MDFVVLVDSQDNEVGIMEKMEAHEKGLLHRAFSIFLFNSKGEMLLQQRALSKYHSPGLWTNACCSHPAPNETTLEAGKRRLQEELGLSTVLVEAFKFEYRATFDNSLTEHELDHVLVGYTDEFPQLNLDEAQDYRWVRWADLLSEMALYPEKFTVWFNIILTEHIEKLEKELCHASM
jgi:isopentenyl-diphosphate delta-isomerase